MRLLKLLYVLAALLWAGYSFYKVLEAHALNHTPLSGGTFACLFLFTAIPVLGYMLLFKLLPLAGRYLTR